MWKEKAVLSLCLATSCQHSESENGMRPRTSADGALLSKDGSHAACCPSSGHGHLLAHEALEGQGRPACVDADV